MKERLRQVTSVAMALLMLLSTISWTVDKHLCMGRIMDISFFNQAEDCGMAVATSMGMLEDSGNHCCDNETFTQVGQDHLQLNWNDMGLEHQALPLAVYPTHLYSSTEIERAPVPLEYYPPPVLTQTLYVLHEVFLI